MWMGSTAHLPVSASYASSLRRQSDACASGTARIAGKKPLSLKNRTSCSLKTFGMASSRCDAPTLVQRGTQAKRRQARICAVPHARSEWRGGLILHGRDATLGKSEKVNGDETMSRCTIALLPLLACVLT